MIDKIQNEPSGAIFSECRLYRYALWRIWDRSKPLVMFIGLNPSKASEKENDPTINSCIRLTNHNGYGGFFMVNCFPFITPYPDEIVIHNLEKNFINIGIISQVVHDVVFAWGNFKIIQDYSIDDIFIYKYPDAKCIQQNKNKSPRHPLFTKGSTEFKPFES